MISVIFSNICLTAVQEITSVARNIVFLEPSLRSPIPYFLDSTSRSTVYRWHLNTENSLVCIHPNWCPASLFTLMRFLFSVCKYFKGKRSDHFLLWQVGNESDVGDDKLVLQKQVFEEDIFLLKGDRLWTEEAHQQLRPKTLRTGCFSATFWLLRKTQWLQDAVLTCDRRWWCDCSWGRIGSY